MTGFGDMWREKILSFKPHITITSNSRDGVIANDYEIASQLRTLPGVTAVSPSIDIKVLAKNDTEYAEQDSIPPCTPFVIGLSQEDALALHPDLAKNIVAGELNLDDNGALLGVDLARHLNVRVGDKVLIYSPKNLMTEDEMYFPEEVVVNGIFHMGQAEFDVGYIITSIAFTRDIMGLVRGGAYSIHIKTDDPQDQKGFNETVNAIRNTLPPEFNIYTWQDVDKELFNAIAVEKNMMVILLMFITVVAIFCVANTIIVITLRKTSEIGLLKALGFSSCKVMTAFMLYGLIQCILGTLLGIALAFLVLHNLQGLVDLLANFGVDVFPKNVYGLDKIPWRIEDNEILKTVLFVIITCTIASILPAWRAAAKKPVEALRS